MSKLLQFASFGELINWSVKTNLSSLIESKYKIVTLGSHIIEQKDRVKPFDFPEDDFKILGVSNKVGLFDNEIKKGKEINQAYKIVKNGYLAYNPYRINVGSIGLKTDEQKYDLISPAYVVFSCKDTLLPEYLFLIFKTQKFNTIINESTRGSVRQILAFDILETLKIPLPTIEEQKEIVNKYHEKINLSKEQERKASQKENDIEKYLFAELELKTNSNETSKLLNFTNLKNLTRWDISFLLDSKTSHSKYPLNSINSVLYKFLKNSDNTSLRFDSSKYPNEKFNYIGMENIEKESGKLLKLDEVNGSEIKSQTIKLPKGFFLYGKLRPYLNKYFFNDLKFGNIIVSSEFFVFSVKNINELYFKYILSSSFIQSQIENHMKGARMPRISEDTFKSLLIPMPPIEVQNEIAHKIELLKNEIKSLNLQSDQNKDLAIQDFESEIFHEA